LYCIRNGWNERIKNARLGGGRSFTQCHNKIKNENIWRKLLGIIIMYPKTVLS
jgi:hypothetical protein